MSSRIICDPPDNNHRDEALTRSARFGWFPPMNSRFLPTAFTHSLTASYKSSRTSSRSWCLHKENNQFEHISLFLSLTFYNLSPYGQVLVCKYFRVKGQSVIKQWMSTGVQNLQLQKYSCYSYKIKWFSLKLRFCPLTAGLHS